MKSVVGRSIAIRSALSGSLRSNAILTRCMSIDVHTHMYTPKYMDILRKRAEIPRVLNIGGQDRLVILPGEDKEVTTSTGRPIGKEYYDVQVLIVPCSTVALSFNLCKLLTRLLDVIDFVRRN